MNTSINVQTKKGEGNKVIEQGTQKIVPLYVTLVHWDQKAFV